MPSKKIKGSNSRKEEKDGMGNRNNEGGGGGGGGGRKRGSETSLIYDGLYYTYATSSRRGLGTLDLFACFCVTLH